MRGDCESDFKWEVYVCVPAVKEDSDGLWEWCVHTIGNTYSRSWANLEHRLFLALVL